MATSETSWFSEAKFFPPEAIFALTAQYVADPFPQKANLGQGTYRDAQAQPWVLPSVAKAREAISHELNHEYLPILGLASFRETTAKIVLGTDIYSQQKSKIATCQGLSGTGSLHLAGLLLRAVKSKKLPKVYIPEPTWSNHYGVFQSLGFPCEGFKYYDASTRDLDFESYYSAIQQAEPGSVVILHACAHNPTGCDPTKEQWRQIAQVMKERNLFPLFDAPYLGFNSGSFDEDAFAIRLFVGEMQLECAICVSFAKNMGLYGERVGCVLAVTNSEQSAANSQSMLEQFQRSEVSNPPAYGAKIASKILETEELRQSWFEDMKTMSGRIADMRKQLYERLVALGAPGSWEHLIRQSGMFGFLGLSPEVVIRLREEYHVYMAANSRISIAGLNPGNVDYVAQSIAKTLKDAAT